MQEPSHKFGRLTSHPTSRHYGYDPAQDFGEQWGRRKDAEQGSAELLRRLKAEHGEQGRPDFVKEKR